MGRITFGLVLLVSLLLTSLAGAQPPPAKGSDEAKLAALPFAQKGLDLFDAGKYVEAVAEFERAEALFHAPTHLKYMAEAHEKLGQLLEAQQRYGEAIADQLPPDAPAVFRQVQVEARQALTSLVQRIPTLAIEVRGVERERVRVAVDGEDWPSWWKRPRRFNPGEHQLTALADGHEQVSRSVTLTESQHESIVLELSPLGDAPPGPDEPAGGGSYVPAIVAFGVGGAGLLIGAITGGMSLGKVGELEDLCPTKSCAAEDEELADEAKTLGNVSTAGFVIGGVGVAAGIALLIWRPGGEEEPSDVAWTIEPRIGLGALSLEGTF